MMQHAKLLETNGTNKEKEWKPMVVERGKTCSRSKEDSNFNRVSWKVKDVYPYLQIRHVRSSKDHW
jgi:hypothetical protein